MIKHCFLCNLLFIEIYSIKNDCNKNRCNPNAISKIDVINIHIIQNGQICNPKYIYFKRTSYYFLFVNVFLLLVFSYVEQNFIKVILLVWSRGTFLCFLFVNIFLLLVFCFDLFHFLSCWGHILQSSYWRFTFLILCSP